ARCQSWPDFRPEAPQLFEGLLPSHPREMGEDDEGLEPEDLLHLAQRVACLLGCTHDPGLACHAFFEGEGRAARQRWRAAEDVRPWQVAQLVVARPCRADRDLRRVGYVEIHLEHTVFTRSEPDAVGVLGHGAVLTPPGH